MPRILPTIFAVLASCLLAVPATAQETGIHWQQDIESAKAQARQSGRLVLVHVVADGCGPCRSLESNVFSQPGVAGAIEARFVPVKLNANEYPAIAQGFGITRVPTDVIITPDGQIVGKQISPATPSAYVSDTVAIANQHASKSGGAYQIAAADAPNPPTLNAAYAGLAIGAPIPPTTPPLATNNTTPAAGSYNLFTPPAATTTPPAVVANNYAAPATPGYGETAPTTPIAATPANPAANPYAAYAPPTAVQPQPPVSPQSTAPIQPAVPPSQSAPRYDVPTDLSVPPTMPAGPTSEEAQRPTTTQQAAAVPDASKLPPGAPPLGFDGYCPVSMRRSWTWTAGDPKFGAIHRGRTYWFVGPQEQQEFLARPDAYGPALAGADPVLAIDHGQSVPGVRDHSLDYDGQFYLFSSEATLQQFTSNPERYASGVRQAMGLPPSQQTR